ncbi:pH-response regulator protein palH/rim21 [Gnomoniopsis smithogilvyi]|uniref:PH-response regulator protein palH/rim21 n=1 Tax=Gnomoniopsis smithogilvyi TaxID=1191159 RepID=A0A9W8YT69_9PEZI|nr:pH-response regulator protein palH/rim21 [Gnomoniopsis smithogilvyi]
MDPRQLIAGAAAETASSLASKCSPVSLPEGGVINIPGQPAITLSAVAAFIPQCTHATSPAIIANGGGVTLDQTSTTDSMADTVEFSDFRDPFYASTFPQCYALAATTVIAYTLVIMLFITPRSFLDGGVVVLGRSGFTSGGTGGQNIGGRPWLQKVAALFVAVSLTIATVDTFRVAEQQYSIGIQNAVVLQQDVLGGTELKVIRIISEAFLWLAQAQTLIRLFPRQREKIIIKWTAFALIGFGVLFDSLNSFMYTNAGSLRPRSFTDAIPALSYLFQLSLGVLYAAWVVYYSLMKKHYAYYHPQMRNIGLVALLSITAVLVPIVFFILDICKPDFTGWGDYVRWVGAAAASVIVWEWVERIESLEREEKKDGILGREVFDGDEMLGMSASEFSWPRKRKNTKFDDGDEGGEKGASGGVQSSPSPNGKSNVWPIVSSLATRYRQRSRSRSRDAPGDPESGTRGGSHGESGARRFLQPPLWPTRPQPVATPVSRTETPSTVYQVRYQPNSDTASRTATEPLREATPASLPAAVPEVEEPAAIEEPSTRRSSVAERGEIVDRGSAATPEPSVTPSQSASQVAARAAGIATTNTNSVNTANPSSAARMRGLVQATQLFRKPSREGSSKPSEPSSQEGRRNLKSRLEDFAVNRAEKLRDRMRPELDTEALPTLIIPAPARRGAAVQALREQQANAEHAANLLGPQPLTQTSSHVTGTPPVESASASPRLWRSHSGNAEAVPSRSDSL